VNPQPISATAPQSLQSSDTESAESGGEFAAMTLSAPVASSPTEDSSTEPAAAETAAAGAPDDPLRERMAALIETWFEGGANVGQLSLSHFDESRRSALSDDPGDGADLRNAMQWHLGAGRLHAYLQLADDAGLSADASILRALANPLGSMSAPDVDGLPSIAGSELRPLKGLTEGFAKL
jgi:hypothetical protein